jgi:LysR family transcriptional regulator of abg operon
MAIKLHQIRDLLAVAEKGSLRAAARHLGLAQPSISRSIRELERELGAPLLERHARGTVLTPSGRLFARRASAAASELRRAREEIDQLHGPGHGSVALACSAVPQLVLLPAALRAFRERYPRVELHLLDSAFPAVEARLKDGSIDFYVGVAPQAAPGPDLLQEKLFDNLRVVVGRHGHPLSGATTLAELKDAEWVGTSITDDADAEFRELFRAHKLPRPRVAARTGGGSLSLITMLSSTDLLAIVPRQWTEYSPLAATLQKIAVREKIAAPPICIIRRAALPLTPAADFLCDLMRRAAAASSRSRR